MTNLTDIARRQSLRHKIKLLVMIIFLAGTACVIQLGPPPSPPPCPIEMLLIDESMFHKDFFQTGPPSKDAAPARFGVNKLGIGFSSMAQGGGIQNIYEGRNIEQTTKQFDEYANNVFSTRLGWTEWYIPDAFVYQSKVADQFRFSCYKHEASGVETCQAVGQYDVYLIRFLADMSTIFTYQDLERILQEIDNKADQCIAR